MECLVLAYDQYRLPNLKQAFAATTSSIIAKIIISRLPGLPEKSSAVIGQFVITTAVRGVPKPQQTACLFWFGYPPSRELETN